MGKPVVFLEETVQRECPSCAAVIELPARTMEGEIVICPDCGEGWEVVYDPSNIRPVIARKGKEKQTQEYNSLLAKYKEEKGFWVLLPEPEEEEDWGQ